MNHKIPKKDKLSIIIYEMGGMRYGKTSALDYVLDHLTKLAQDKAVALCSEPAELNVSKEYDRGYVKGLIETVTFLRDSRDLGRKLRFVGTKTEPDAVTNKII